MSGRINQQNNKNRLSVPSFLLKTYEMIENNKYRETIQWAEDGQSFIIKNVNDFCQKVLPNYFKHNNFASFVRQLNMYDFHKLRNENNQTEFRHKYFQSGQKNLLNEIKRKTTNQQDLDDNLNQVSQDDFSELEEIKSQQMQTATEIKSIKDKQLEIEHQLLSIQSQNINITNDNLQIWENLKSQKQQEIDKLDLILNLVSQQYQLIYQNEHNNTNQLPVKLFQQQQQIIHLTSQYLDYQKMQHQQISLNKIIEIQKKQSGSSDTAQKQMKNEDDFQQICSQNNCLNQSQSENCQEKKTIVMKNTFHQKKESGDSLIEQKQEQHSSQQQLQQQSQSAPNNNNNNCNIPLVPQPMKQKKSIDLQPKNKYYNDQIKEDTEKYPNIVQNYIGNFFYQNKDIFNIEQYYNNQYVQQQLLDIENENQQIKKLFNSINQKQNFQHFENIVKKQHLNSAFQMQQFQNKNENQLYYQPFLSNIVSQVKPDNYNNQISQQQQLYQQQKQMLDDKFSNSNASQTTNNNSSKVSTK